MQKKLIVVFVTLIFALVTLVAIAIENQPVNSVKVLRPIITQIPPKLDGVLDDEAWKSGPIIDEDLYTYQPSWGEVLPQKTRIYATYDLNNLYFAFYCQDPEPNKIKATMAKRDSTAADDWVDIIIDTIGKKQSAYVFSLNPLGIQSDLFMLNDGTVDASPDYVWYSAGRLVEDGYIVEYRIPLESIRYSAGKDVVFGIFIVRFVSRTGSYASWPQRDPSKGTLEQGAQIIYGELDSAQKLEFLPSVTYSSLRDRISPEDWSDADNKADAGLGVTYGISSKITLEATVNPDFNQVESDEFQIIANQRYPIFYSEKRPFFMEVNNIFNLAGTSSSGNMTTAVHTRKIIDPDWGLKFNGEIGPFTFSFLTVSDAYPGRKYEDAEANPSEGNNALFYIARTKYALGNENYIGAIFVTRDFAGESNKVLGGDFKFRLDSHSFLGNVLYSTFNNGTDTDGMAVSLKYSFSDKPLTAELGYEHFDENFRMDTAFYNRVGFTNAIVYIGPKFYPDPESISWLKKINPYVSCNYLHDTITGQDDYLYMMAFLIEFTSQGYVRFGSKTYQEYWVNQAFNGSYLMAEFGIRPVQWFYITAFARLGNSIYYDPINPFKGEGRTYVISTDIQPSEKLSFSLSYTRQEFDDKADQRFYNLDVANLKAAYQFNENLFLRGIIQYDSYNKVILTDLLASFTLIPGTVVHIGYGSLYNKIEWNQTINEWFAKSEFTEWYQTHQSFFFKASYLFRL